MNVKQIILTLIVLFSIDSVAMSQVKKQYRDEVHKATTIVIKEDGANDFDILNSQFNLDDYKVNEQIKITTDQSIAAASTPSKNVSGGQSIILPTPDLISAMASTTNDYKRPKTKMKRWSVREKKETMTVEETIVKTVEEKSITETPTMVEKKTSRTKNISNAKKSKNGKYRKKSKKVKKKSRVKRLKKRKRKVRRNKKGACYKF